MKSPEEIEKWGRGYEDWLEAIKQAGVFDQIPGFNDIISGKDKPTTELEPVVKDVELDGIMCDIYHWGGGSARIYIYQKG